jgi:hypothetical protein
MANKLLLLAAVILFGIVAVIFAINHYYYYYSHPVRQFYPPYTGMGGDGADSTLHKLAFSIIAMGKLALQPST